MKTLNKIFCMGALFAGVTANAQQSPIYNMQFMNQSLYNPATIGIGDQVPIGFSPKDCHLFDNQGQVFEKLAA